MRIALAFAKHNWIALGKAKLELDWIFQFNYWITTGSLRITTGLVLSPKTLMKFSFAPRHEQKEMFMSTKGKIRPKTLMKNYFAPRHDQKTGKNWLKLFFVEIETLLDYFGGGSATTGLELGRTGSLLVYMHSGPTGATYLPDLYRLPYPTG